MARKKSRSMKFEMQNAAKTLLANIRFASVDSPIASLVVTSSIPNEGKSTVAVNLAEAIATSGKSVLLVECDFRNRTLASMLNVRAQGGIYAVLSEEMPLEQAVAPTTVPNMYLLDVEPHIPNPADVLSSKRFRRMVDALEERYDYVIYDTPPVGTFVDAAILSTLADGTVLVVRENFTKRDAILEAHDQLRKAGANVIGVVMNYCETTANEYYYAYYRQNGELDHTSAASEPGMFVSTDVRRVGGKHGTPPNRARRGQ